MVDIGTGCAPGVHPRGEAGRKLVPGNLVKAVGEDKRLKRDVDRTFVCTCSSQLIEAAGRVLDRTET